MENDLIAKNALLSTLSHLKFTTSRLDGFVQVFFWLTSIMQCQGFEYRLSDVSRKLYFNPWFIQFSVLLKKLHQKHARKTWVFVWVIKCLPFFFPSSFWFVGAECIAACLAAGPCKPWCFSRDQKLTPVGLDYIWSNYSDLTRPHNWWPSLPKELFSLLLLEVQMSLDTTTRCSLGSVLISFVSLAQKGLRTPGTPNNHFLMDVWWNNRFPCKDLESSNWNNLL